MTNVRGETGTMHCKVHEWLKFGDEWWKDNLSYLTANKKGPWIMPGALINNIFLTIFILFQ